MNLMKKDNFVDHDSAGIRALETFNVDKQRRRVESLELSAVMSTGRGFMLVYMALMIAAFLIIEPGISRATAAVWVITYLIYTVIRTIATAIYHEDWRREELERVRYWRRFVFLSALTHGLILGSLALIALPQLSATRQLLLTCFVLLITTGAVIYVSAILPALVALTSAALFPYILAWMWQSNVFEVSISLCLFVAWTINLFMSWVHHGTVSRILCLAAENEILGKNLVQKNRELEAADHARLQLMAITSHDLRQPIHALRLILANISEHDDINVLHQHFRRLKEVSNLVAQMLTELMDLSAIENKSYVKRSGSVCLSDVLRQLKISQEPIAQRKGISLEVHLDSEIWVEADANLLRRMLLNLISNAIKYTAIGSVSIECVVERDHALVRVRDTGIGIPTERLNDIFRPYVKLDSLTSEGDGVGLGLAIVHRAALIQGLQVRASSKIGIGSIFEVEIPVLANQQADHVGGKAGFFESQAASNVLIAVIDDDFFALEALVGLLKSWGYLTVSAQEPTRLKELLARNEKPSLIIADNHLSKIEFGPDVILNIRKWFDDENIPGIILTGDTELVLDGLAFVELVHKPLDPELLRGLVSSMAS